MSRMYYSSGMSVSSFFVISGYLAMKSSSSSTNGFCASAAPLARASEWALPHDHGNRRAPQGRRAFGTVIGNFLCFRALDYTKRDDG